MHLFVWSIVAYMFCCFLRSLVLQILVLQANTNMHNKMTLKILRATILFFDSNPSGRVSTRFSRDMTILDVPLPPLTMIVTQGLLRTLSVVISVSIINPYLIAVGFIGLLYMMKIVKTGIAPMIEAQKLDMIFYGPIN